MNAINFPACAPAAPLQSEARERPLDLRELRYFHSVARTGSFGRAAREPHIGRPALSRQGSKLEVGIGAQLLVRYGRGAIVRPREATAAVVAEFAGRVIGLGPNRRPIMPLGEGPTGTLSPEPLNEELRHLAA